jgi:hypothetical protein
LGLKLGVEESGVEMSFNPVLTYPLTQGEGMYSIAIWVVEFSNGGYKIRKVFA